ncbi:transglycosylase domain-containing protein [Flavobacterium subsaxonicum]|uniref:Glycosyl transferase n=1 Tax=Flavobacterium subsaxonicum WB 4.1-42 = DSM 21790 TaxID=1121898 RepID=A0A0A2MFY7_9FLAO|nr:biosynthetic peptidoglycan transglycosylase [Flavobacterium subsaxonicum]KGO91154.1 glycosyl transferase [Flavobacterium subsaxonicum WB 4.1-42 = DSM 21790]
MRKLNFKKIAFRALIILGVLFIVAAVSFFAFRNMALQKAIVKVSDKMARDYNASFTVKSASFKGLSGIEMKGITVVPKNADTLLQVEQVTTSINLSKILLGDVQLGTLEMTNGYVQLVKKDSLGWNFRSFMRPNKKDKEEDTDTGDGYADRAYRILTKVLNLVPTDMKLQNLALRVNDMGRKVNLNMQQLRLADNKLESTINVTEDTITQTWKVNGMADPRNRLADLKFFNTDTSRIIVPYIQNRYKIKTGFDAIHVNLQNMEMDGGELHIDGYASIQNFMVNQPRLAVKDVVIDNARFDYHMLFGDDFIALDSTSTVQLNKIKFSPFAKFSVEKDTIYQLKAHIPKMPAQDFISSLPNGLFTNFEGMEAEGDFSYNLNFLYNKNKPHALVFDSSIKKDGLKITKYGAANLAKLNTEFTYRAIDNGRAQRPVIVGYGNPYYTPLDQISPFLRKAVLTSEDPSFFSHRGFITEAFRQSIIKNIKTKKFSRGGSTISMQLVKNVFLNRNKTLSRKLEEILLVYILENNRIASKERMLEVYFNIIEWGPDVYGIGEAASYYFDKAPSQLTLDECVYLASIIPSPKTFMYRFGEDGNLKGYAQRHNKYMRDIMLRRGLITAEDTIAQSGKITINGRGRGRLRLNERSIFVADSVQIDEFFKNLSKQAF